MTLLRCVLRSDSGSSRTKGPQLRVSTGLAVARPCSLGTVTAAGSGSHLDLRVRRAAQKNELAATVKRAPRRVLHQRYACAVDHATLNG